MSKLHEAARAVVERWDTPLWKDAPATAEYIAALREALERQKTDPVARNGWVLRDVLFDNGEPVGHREPQPLPPPECQTDAEKTAFAFGWFKALEQAQPAQAAEPVAYAVYDIKHGGSATLHWTSQHCDEGDADRYRTVPLFTAPQPARQPLTDMEISVIALQQIGFDGGLQQVNGFDIKSLVRAVEAAHGITGGKHVPTT